MSPRHELVAQHGVVVIPTRELRVQGGQVGQLLDVFAPQVAVLLGVSACNDIEVQLHEEELVCGAVIGETIAYLEYGDSQSIHLGMASFTRGLLRYALAHELVHWYASEHDGKLPFLLEEALADYIGRLTEPPGRLDPPDLLDDIVNADSYQASFGRVFTLEIEEFHALSEEDQRRALSQAQLVAKRIGFWRLMAQATNAELSLEALIAAAQ